jgi:hypothetical protein
VKLVAGGSQILAANEGEGSPEERLHTAADPSGAADCNGMTGCLKGDHQYVALRRQEVVRWANSPSTEKTHYERKRRKIGTDQHDEDQQQTEKGLTIGHLEFTITV